MNFVGFSIQLQVEGSEESPSAPSVILQRKVQTTQPSGIAVGKPAGTVRGARRKALETIERHVRQESENARKHFRPPALSNMHAGDLEDMGILVGEVYDEKIIEESYSE